MNDWAYITITSKSVIFEGPYNEGFKGALKASIPHVDREWDGEQKVWKIKQNHLDRLKKLVKKHYPRCCLVEGAVTTDLHTGDTIEPYVMHD